MRIFDLGERLGACASYVREGARVADIGTDHAFLPIWLVKKGICSAAIASDINELPAKKAADNVEKYKVGDKVKVFTSDGLEKIAPNEVDDVINAGMGAEVITDIIERAKWLCDGKYRLILQPMSRVEHLRKYLFDNGFEILDEKIVCEGGRVYIVACAQYVGETKNYTTFDIYAGSLADKKDKNSEFLLKKQIKVLQNKAKAFGEDDPEYKDLIETADRIRNLLDEK